MKRYCLWDGSTRMDDENTDIFCPPNRERYEELKGHQKLYCESIDDDREKVWETLVSLASPSTDYFYDNIEELKTVTGLEDRQLRSHLYDLRDDGYIKISFINRSKSYSPSIQVMDKE